MPPAVATPACLCSCHCSSHCADKEPSQKNGKIPNRAWPRRLRLVRKASTVVCILTHWLVTISRRNFRSIPLSGAIYRGGVFKQQGSNQTTNFAVSKMRTKISACEGANIGESFVTQRVRSSLAGCLVGQINSAPPGSPRQTPVPTRYFLVPATAP